MLVIKWVPSWNMSDWRETVDNGFLWRTGTYWLRVQSLSLVDNYQKTVSRLICHIFSNIWDLMNSFPLFPSKLTSYEPSDYCLFNGIRWTIEMHCCESKKYQYYPILTDDSSIFFSLSPMIRIEEFAKWKMWTVSDPQNWKHF